MLPAGVSVCMSHSFGHRPVYNADEKQHDGSEIKLGKGRMVTPEEMKAFAAKVDEDLGVGVSDSIGLISTTTGLRVLNFGAFDNNQEFQAYVY